MKRPFGVRNTILLIVVYIFGGIVFFSGSGLANAQQGPGPVENNPFLVTDQNADKTSNADGTYNSDPNATDASAAEKALTDFFELVLKVLYLLLRPLLAIAGASLDNTLVYGDIFYLDKALRQFWQMIRTFANFGLGFIFLASILVAFIGGGGEKLKKIDARTIIKKLFLAGILINMSRFIVAALLDLSTVLVFSLGALPLNVVRDDTSDQGLGKVRFLTTHSFYNQDSSVQTTRDQVEHSIIYSCPGPDAGEGQSQKTYYLPCRVEAGNFVEKGKIDEPNSRESYKQKYKDAWSNVGNEEVGDNISDDYCARGLDLVQMEFGQPFDPAQLKLFRDAAQQELKDKECSTIDTLMEKAQGMTGPLYTLYSSILHMGEVGVTINNKTTVEAGLEFFMRAMVAIALFLPLLALAVVLVMRAVILWLIIAFSPLLVLVYVFEFKGKENFDLNSVMGLIFLPVFAVFAVSLSIIFLSLVGRIDFIDNVDGCKEDAFSKLTGAEITSCPPATNDTCYKLFNITNICFTESERTTGANIVNTLSWLVVNFFGIAMMRTLVFFTLTSNKITGKIAGKIESFGKGLAMSTPIIPLPAGLGGLTSLGALKDSKDYLRGRPDAIASQQFEQGLGKKIENWQKGSDSTKTTNQNLSDKVTQASNGQSPTFNPSSDFVIPDNTDHNQFSSLGPSLGLAAKVPYTQAKDMTFSDAYSNPQTRKYMQDNELYNTEARVKGSGANIPRAELARNMEATTISSGGISLGNDTTNANSTRYVLGGYITHFPRGNSAKGILNSDIKNFSVVANPTKKEDWDKFYSFFNATDSAGIRNNPEIATLFPYYMGLINTAFTGGSATWTDSATDPTHPKTYTITTTNAGGKIGGFDIR